MVVQTGGEKKVISAEAKSSVQTETIGWSFFRSNHRVKIGIGWSVLK